LAALGLLLLVCRFADRHLGRGTAWIAGAALVLSPLFLIFARMVIFDMPLTLCATLSTMAAFEAMEGGGAGARAAGPLLFAAAGIGTLIKGPVSLILPLLVAAAWALVRRRPALLLRLRPRIGLAIYAAFVLPWLALVSARHPGYLEYALWGENLARLGSNLFETARPFHFYLKII